MLKRTLLAATLVAAAIASGFSLPRQEVLAQQAPQPTIKRSILQRFEVPNSNYEVVLGVAEVPPNTSIGRHFHFGAEMGTLIEGEATMYVDGQPEKLMKPGDSYLIPEKVVHDARSGPKGAKVMAVYTILKGQPFATPAK
ncbi:MAG: cupin domain-containing protein [Hyphomicrobiaceae bacterium]|nr:MAG: cupin domain-containing protein [Hyphomicrobiaceae bacterium]